ncbi:MAG TPA: 2-isopropylmalate synthase [Candidatus Acidoferrales bacterium]|jgi:2-isopropylmalate synthase|nr:2-isopropylmalate synthase [Candidatus Acidoferrales bacterium]
MEQVHIFDTTLRDGEQSPGFSMNREEKLQLARQLEELGVDVIEAGFPIASPGDLEAVRAVSAEIKSCRVAALARARQEDVDAALRAIEPAAKPRLHIFLASSDLHLKHKLRISRSEALEQIATMVRYGVKNCEEVEFSAEDASRTDLDFLLEVIEAAASAGATIINLPDTVGYTTPEEYGDMFRLARKHLAAYPKIIFSAHCHNDLGLAVANSLAAIAAGARQVECTINGIGERAGNASLEEVAVALHVRKGLYGVGTRILLEKIYATSRMLSSITSINVPPNKAVVGANAFAHEAGIHQDGILKNPLTYEIILPEKVGVPARRLVLGKHSGRNALRVRLEELGYPTTNAELAECYAMATARADAAKQVTDRDLLSIIHKVRRGRDHAPARTTASAASTR